MIVRFCKASQTPVYPMWANNFRFERWSIVEVVGLLDTAGSVELLDAGGGAGRTCPAWSSSRVARRGRRPVCGPV